ncbi:type II toxin-antitoxin system RelE/ParE family toxin [Flavobacterium sp. UMI-01]|uniref:type II toxin-antitoxin system RelE/ParE family toxin n=1 Tax=Flavobacterium sp. UMI-01 TaxID=1441053 RepID=UPI001C7E07B3|nr:hypothetical protein FUMI01_18480 [Flavobacterium sp. UMI-01]
MKREVVITPLAFCEIENLFEFLILKWNHQVKTKFSNKLHGIINLIAENPEMFPVSNKSRNIRRCVISNQCMLFYKFNDKHIVILSLFDTRQDPNKINKIK